MNVNCLCSGGNTTAVYKKIIAKLSSERKNFEHRPRFSKVMGNVGAPFVTLSTILYIACAPVTMCWYCRMNSELKFGASCHRSSRRWIASWHWHCHWNFFDGSFTTCFCFISSFVAADWLHYCCCMLSFVFSRDSEGGHSDHSTVSMMSLPGGPLIPEYQGRVSVVTPFDNRFEVGYRKLSHTDD